MTGILGAACYNQLVRHVLRRERVYRDRQNTFDRYDDWDFKRRFRFSRAHSEHILIDLLEDSLRHYNNKPTNISPVIQVTIGLRFFCTG